MKNSLLTAIILAILTASLSACASNDDFYSSLALEHHTNFYGATYDRYYDESSNTLTDLPEKFNDDASLDLTRFTDVKACHAFIDLLQDKNKISATTYDNAFDQCEDQSY